MFVHPWTTGDWKYVQEVWDRWQTFNAGAVAFLASLIALNIAKLNENSQREREFIAAKAYLPSTLSSLIEYYKQSARTLSSLWSPSAANGAQIHLPSSPTDYRDVFSNCIRHAEPAVGTYLSNVLTLLQIHEARMKDAVGSFQTRGGAATNQSNLITYLMRLGELYALAANLFEFARGKSPFQDKQLAWEDLRQAFSLLDLEPDEFSIDEKVNLTAFTQRWLVRTSVHATGAPQ